MKDNQKEILSRVLTTGANGMVGGYVDFGTRLDRRSLDVSDLNETMSVIKRYMPKSIIHLAAETNVDRCDRDPQHAYLINSIGTYNVALAAKEVGAKMIYISTSAVFDGSKKEPYVETDKPNPLGYYGRSKFLGEVIVKEILDNYIIGRIAWVFGGGPEKDQKFVARIIEQTKKPEIDVVSGKYGSPTYGKDLVSAVKKMILENRSGVFHMSNTGAPSRVDVAREIVSITNSDTIVTEVDSSFFDNMYSEKRLDNESMISGVDIMRSWQGALKEYIEKEWSDYIK